MPQVPIQLRRRIVDGERASDLVLPEYHLHTLQLSQSTLANQFDRLAKPMVATLPRADLDNAARFLNHFANQLAFVDRQCQRLLAVDVLTGAACIDEHLRVPMVGGADGYYIDVVAGEQVLIIFVNLRSAAETSASLLQDVPIDVAEGNEVAMGLRLQGNHGSLIPQTDTTDVWAIILAPIITRVRRGPRAQCINRQASQSSRRGRRRQRTWQNFFSNSLRRSWSELLVTNR